jgi:hypothetical protein
MPGYANRIVTINFPELTADGDPLIHVVMRNPRLVPPGEMMRGEVPLGPDGTPDTKAAMSASYEILAKLIIGWHVYDATDASEGDQARLTLPATAAAVGKLPMEILNKLAEQLTAVNPQTATASPEAGTTRT